MTETVAERAGRIESDQKLVASIVYLSSLASEVREIDPMLDTLRSVSARWDQNAPLSESDRAALQKLILDLKYYLVKRDPLRNFTIESLDTRLENELMAEENEVTTPFALILTACVAVAATILIVPIPLADADRTYLSVTALLVMLISTTVLLYLSSLRNFKHELRNVFLYLCAGAGLLVVTCLHYALIGIFGVTDQPLFRYGGATEIALFAIIAMYLGLSRYAKILNVSTRSTRIQLTISLIATVILSSVVVFVREIPDKIFFSVSFIATLATGFYALFGAMIAHALIKNVTASYAKSLRIVQLFLFGVFTTALAFIVALTWLGQLSVGALSLLIAAAGVPTMMLLTYSGYSFKKETGR